MARFHAIRKVVFNHLRSSRFVPFHERKAVRIYRRNLPHWRQDGCTYFVTFRLADSIPLSVHEQWEHKQTLWLEARGIHLDGPKAKGRSEFETLTSRERFLFAKYFNQQVQACLDLDLVNMHLSQTGRM